MMCQGIAWESCCFDYSMWEVSCNCNSDGDIWNIRWLFSFASCRCCPVMTLPQTPMHIGLIIIWIPDNHIVEHGGFYSTVYEWGETVCLNVKTAAHLSLGITFGCLHQKDWLTCECAHNVRTWSARVQRSVRPGQSAFHHNNSLFDDTHRLVGMHILQENK